MADSTNPKEEHERWKKTNEELKVKNNDLKKLNTSLTMRVNEAMEAFKKLEEELRAECTDGKTHVSFVGKDTLTDGSSYKFVATINSPFVLQPGQALLTFERKEVAENIIKKKQFTLNFEGTCVCATALPVSLNKSIQFQVDTGISSKQVRVVNLPPDLPDEYIKEKLELKFYKSDIGGGEIENVEYNRDSNSAIITYLNNGAAPRVLKQKRHQLFAGNASHEVALEPCVCQALNNLQLSSDVSQRSVLLTGVVGVKDTEESIQDEIEIHFQKPSNGGGELESIVYTQNEERVLRFEQN